MEPSSWGPGAGAYLLWATGLAVAALLLVGALTGSTGQDHRWGALPAAGISLPMAMFAFVTLTTVAVVMLAGAVALSRHARPQRAREADRHRRARSRHRWLFIAAAAGLVVVAACVGLAALIGTDAIALIELVAGCGLYCGLIAWAVVRGAKRRDEDDGSDDGGSGRDDGPSPTEPLGGLEIDWERFEREAFLAYQAHSERELAGAL